jgi:hypothetical protein
MSYASIIKEVKRQDSIISMRYRQWLAQHGDDPLPDWVIERISEQLGTKQRDRTNSFSASSAGQCLRRQELQFLGIPPEFGMTPNAQLLNVFNDGRWRHLRWQANLLAAGILDRIEVPVPWTRMRAKGSIDGAGWTPSDQPRVAWRNKEFGWELKGMNEWVYLRTAGRNRKKEEHLKQIHRYMLQGGFDLWVLLCEDKNSNDWKEWVIEPDDILMAEVEQELREMNRAIDRKKLHPMLTSCSKRMGPTWEGCPYTKSNGVCESAGRWPLTKSLKSK